MEPQQKYFTAGAFTLVSLVGLLVFGLWLQGSLEKADKACYYMRFDNSVSGLNPGSVISFRGVGIGQVDTIRINPANDAEVQVKALLDANAPIHPETVAQLKPQGITGSSYIELDLKPGSTGSGEMSNNGGCRVITTLPSDIQKVLNTLPEILDRALQVVTRIENLLGDQNTTNFTGVLQNLNNLTAQISSETKVLGPQLNGSAVKLQATLGHLNEVTGQLSNGSAGNLQSIQGAVRQTNAAMEQVRNLVEDLRSNPQRTILAPHPAEVKVPQ